MLKIFINKGKAGKRGLLYDVEHEGKMICQSSLTPLVDACRVLFSRGYTGDVEMWDYDRPYARMRSTVECAARLAIIDRGSGPVFVKWRPKGNTKAADSQEEDAD